MDDVNGLDPTLCELRCTLRQLHTFNRARIKQGTLSLLALIDMYGYYLTDINLDDVADLFAKKPPRKLELSTLLQDQQ